MAGVHKNDEDVDRVEPSEPSVLHACELDRRHRLDCFWISGQLSTSRFIVITLSSSQLAAAVAASYVQPIYVDSCTVTLW